MAEAVGAGGALSPILVTGMPRSGTTWVGRMLDATPETGWISEPFNLDRAPTVFRAPVPHWFMYVTSDNDAAYVGPMLEALRFDSHYLDDLKAVRSKRDFVQVVRRWRVQQECRGHRKRPLVKEPHAVFSAEWLARRFGFAVVITVRHPVAVVSSWKRLNWPFDFGHLLSQPLLVRDWLEPFRREIEAAARDPDDLIGHVALLWRLVYGVVAHYQERFPEFHVVRQEDLSLDPVGRFAELYSAIALPFTDEARRAIEGASSATNPREVSAADPYGVRLDSRANLENWKRRLSETEVARIRSIAGDIAALYYPEEPWLRT